MQGRLGRFFALGTSSRKRGYYFSHPVRDNRRIIGVMVVKVGVDEIEQYLRTSQHQAFVTDPAGVIVLAGHPDWRLKTLGPVPEAERARIAAVRQYDLAALAPAAITVGDAGPVPGAAELVTARPDRSDARPQEFPHLTAPMVAEDWTMHLLVSTAPARAAALATAALSASLLLAAGLGVALVRQRRRPVARARGLRGHRLRPGRPGARARRARVRRRHRLGHPHAGDGRAGPDARRARARPGDPGDPDHRPWRRAACRRGHAGGRLRLRREALRPEAARRRGGPRLGHAPAGAGEPRAALAARPSPSATRARSSSSSATSPTPTSTRRASPRRCSPSG